MKSKDTFVQIYQRYYPEIYRFVFSVVRSENEAKELTQDTFLALLEELQKREMPPDKLRPWIYRVSKNKSLNVLRTPKHAAAEAGQLGATHNTPEVAMSQKQEANAVDDVMNRLNQRDATLLRLYALELSYEEIAEVVGVERSSVGKMLNRAKKAFRTTFEKRHQTLSKMLNEG